MVVIATWLAVAAPLQADSLPLAASLDSSEGAVGFSAYDFSAVDFDAEVLVELLGRPGARGVQGFLALFSPFHRGGEGPGDHMQPGEPGGPGGFPGHDGDHSAVGVLQWWFRFLGTLHGNFEHHPRVPEPSSGLMLVLGLAACIGLRRRASA